MDGLVQDCSISSTLAMEILQCYHRYLTHCGLVMPYVIENIGQHGFSMAASFQSPD